MLLREPLWFAQSQRIRRTAGFTIGKWYLEQSKKSYGHILDKIMSHTLPFTKYQEAFNIRSKDRIKVIITWG